MKFLFTLLTVLTGSCLFMTSCTDNDVTNSTSSKPVEPGVYYVAMNFYAEKAATKGVNDQDQVFDTNYDYDYIYLHKINAGDEETATIELPVYECDGCDEGQKGIRYRICKYEDGHAVITPIDQNGDHIETSKITLDADDECYFSSWPTNEWKLDDEQIDADSEGNNHFFRNQENNKEIYRSEDTYTIDDLAKDGDLTIVRACAGFALAGMFYDSTKKPVELPGNDVFIYSLEEEEFSAIMGDPNDWYIKIYIGGQSFPNQYDIENGNEMQSAVNGYYSSGRFHGAIDYGVSIGTPVYAAADGVVLTTKSLTTSYGTYVVIQHANGLQTWYAHGTPGSICVSPGETVSQGQMIMKSGNSGNSQGPHLHFEVRKSPYTYSYSATKYGDDCRVNPNLYF